MIYVFDAYELDTRQYELRQRSRPCGLDRQGFNVLVYLVQHRERVVTKDELLAQLWPNQHVSEATLTQRLKAVRRALGDSGRSQRLIKTVHGRGYRFIAAVEERLPDGGGASTPVPPSAALAGEACPQCHHPNPPAARFCTVCATPLGVACPACAGPNPPGAVFCHACATLLHHRPPAASHADETSPGQPSGLAPGSSPANSSLPEAERRYLTVVYCELVDAFFLAEHRDPEDYREVIQTYQATCAAVIQRYEGHIVQGLGEALLVYFGWPTAHEDDAPRAVRAGLEMLAAVADVNRRLQQTHGLHLRMRVAVHTGLVVVGAMSTSGHQDPLALGATPHVAARLQGLAQADTLVISAATQALVQGYFTTLDLGPQTLQGVATPVQVYQVLQASGAQQRFEVARRFGLTPFVGRATELALLEERWQQAREGQGQVVVISGEAGIGKSRLVQRLSERLAAAPHRRLECRCSPYHQHTAFYPLVELLERTVGCAPHETAGARLTQLEATLAPLRLPVDAPVPLLAALLAIPLDEAEVTRSLTSQQQRQHTLTTLVALITAWAEQQPVLLVVEDLHWVDPSTRAWLDLLLDQVPTLPLLVVLTCRPTFQVPWGFRAHLTPMPLSRLPRHQVEAIIGGMTSGKALPPEVIQHLVSRTDGIPLFIEELTRAVLESGVWQETAHHEAERAPLQTLAIPTTLHDSLMARLDRLGTAKGLAQWGATLGRQFSYALLQAASQREETVLQQDLQALIDAELLYPRGLPPHATYRFKHALIQEAAYASLLRRTRRGYHQRIAQVLESQFPEMAETQPEVLAQHYTEAGLTMPALAYWQRAGQHAVQHSAHEEAIAHLRRGLAVLTMMPETPERAQHELALQLALADALAITRGFAASAVGEACARARELCEQVGDTAQLSRLLTRLWTFHLVRAELHTALECAQHCLVLAQQMGDTTVLLSATQGAGQMLLHLGELVTAHSRFEQVLARYTPHHPPQLIGGQELGMLGHSYAARLLWLLGFPDQALQQSNAALRLAREEDNPVSLAYAYVAYAVMLHEFRREPRRIQEYNEAGMAIAIEHDLAQLIALGTIRQGQALTAQAAEEGLARMCQGLAAYQATGGVLRRPYYLSLLAEAYGLMGQPLQALQALDEALTLVEHTAERWWEAELYRLKGVYLVAQGDRESPHVEAAEVCYHRALAIARQQQARSLELRAATSLARLWQQRGQPAEARALLAPLYAWFTEGFGTADLQEAKVLLETLGG